MLKFLKTLFLRNSGIKSWSQGPISKAGNAGIVTGALIAGGASILGGMLGAKGAKSAAAKAADANLRATQETNALNERLFRESRGEGGHAILPTYFGGQEAEFGQRAYDQFNRLNRIGLNSYNQLQGVQSGLTPMFNQGLSALSDRYNGLDLEKRLAYANPLFSARSQEAENLGRGYMDIAQTGQGAIQSGLQRALAQINAQRAAQGYTGGSLFDRNRMAQATIGAQQSAALQLAQARMQQRALLDRANFENAQQRFGLQTADMDFRSNPALAGAAMGAAQSFYGAPAQALSQSFNNAMQPMSFFRLNPQAFQAQNMPTQDPRLNNSQIFGSAIQQAGSTAANYFLNRDLASRFGASNGSPMNFNQYVNQYGAPGQGGYVPVQENWSFEAPPGYIQPDWKF